MASIDEYNRLELDRVKLIPKDARKQQWPLKFLVERALNTLGKRQTSLI